MRTISYSGRCVRRDQNERQKTIPTGKFENFDRLLLALLALLAALAFAPGASAQPSRPTLVTRTDTSAVPRERLSLNSDWRFIKGDPADSGDLSYANLKPWFLSSANAFVVTGTPTPRPTGNLAANVSFVQPGFDDSAWRSLSLPHDWGVEGTFDQGLDGATGRRFYLDIDGAMSFASVWCNGHCVGGWPNGCSSFQLDLTPCLTPGSNNVLVIRIDNPNNSSRWYPGGGIYRNVWLTTTAPVHVGQWGISCVTVAIKDKDGLIVPVADNALHYEISGPGEIVAVDNGDASSLAPFHGSSDSKAFNGLAMIIVRARPGQTGDIKLTAKSDGLKSASVPIAVIKPDMRGPL